ncbi:regulatory protein RecX [Marinicella gelatinilytica]|uniref:regulatory protein RecX n=1 Tax=Marinicella gelatinilytica TaxID=2996017 RepID=UPI0022608246|nr:regulatory protein RecX [Marinicella gelatinilytica]MCX7543759.1 regulatory protein RecX [Marinicella gelatinilytica]
MPQKADDLNAKAKASALASLAMREHSVFELRQKLLRKEIPEQIVTDLLLDLRQQNLLSDSRFAEVYWRQRAGKGFGPNKIAYELQQKGIDDALIQSSQATTEIDFNDVIKQVYAKKYRSQPCHDLKEKAKRQGFLYRRGFSADLIKTVLD